MRVVLLRHGKTPGNVQKRYIGRTDEPIDMAGMRLITENSAKIREKYGLDETCVYVLSPMIRCKQTLLGLFLEEKLKYLIYDKDLRECDFGLFEGKNYKELSDSDEYQAWIDSGGKMDFPGGESLSSFKERTIKAYKNCMKKAEKIGTDTVCFVVHGGTIMAITEAFVRPACDYYTYHVDNLKACVFSWDGETLSEIFE